VQKQLQLLSDWIKKAKVVEVSLNGKGQLVVKLANGKTENLEEKGLTPAQLGLKKYLKRSSKQSLNQSELENLVEGAVKEEKARKRKATIGGLIIFGIIIAIIIGVVV
jgi:hypothetical protein